VPECCPSEEDEVNTSARAGESIRSPQPREDEVTKAIERYTASIPSSAMLALALGAMGLSLMSQLGGRGKWGNFIAQWVPTIIVMGVYNKLVKLEGHDQFDRGQGHQGADPGRRDGSAIGISNRPLAEEQAEQASLPSRGSMRAGV
jgi:hypothetical protein